MKQKAKSGWLIGLGLGLCLMAGVMVIFLFSRQQRHTAVAHTLGREIIWTAQSMQPARLRPRGIKGNVAVQAVGPGRTYNVQLGDTLFGIARRFGVTAQAIAQTNQLLNPNLIFVGQMLLIPDNPAAAPPPLATSAPPGPPAAAPGEAFHIVQAGESLFQIAGRYQTTVSALIALNPLPNPHLIFVGQRLRLPAAGDAPPPPVVLEPTAVGTPPPPAEGGLIWPNDYRRLYQRYRYGHGAIDIAMPVGTAVGAAAAGVVEFAGWHAAGFGYLVVVDHQNGVRTFYAHNSELLVQTGQSVGQGETIAKSGSTGNSTHPHLHFGMTENMRLMDPCTRLPGGC